MSSTPLSSAEAIPARRSAGLAISFLFLVATLLLAGGRSLSAAPPARKAEGKSLIYAGWYGNTMPTPSHIANNFAFLESQPFHGLAVYMRNPTMSINATTAIMKPAPISYEAISSVLAPMAGLNFSQLRDNFAVVMGSGPPDFFDSWSVTVQNFANLAAAARDAGLRGVIFDNEQYFSPWGNYPTGVKYPGTSLAAYEDQAVLRGRQCMEAMVAQFPDIVVLTLHGPYVSEPDAPSSLLFPQWQSGNELLGPFFSGFQEGSVRPGQNVDGGELYDLRSESEFANSYDWRKNGLPSSQVNCSFIDPALRTSWADNVSLSFGVYDRPFAGRSMTSSILTTTLHRALTQADEFVWFYAEGATYLLPPSQGGASTEWVSAVRAALPAAETQGPFTRSGTAGGGLSFDSSGSGGGGGGNCGLLGMEVVPLFFALLWMRSKKRN
jgi:hypothetical protein